MKLYKFRPLGSGLDFDRLKSIIETGEFWCAKFSELNDPMEGSFTALNDPNLSETIYSIYSEKERYRICSFSGEEAFSNPLMWGYYANGFKGVTIEIEVSSTEVEKIKYVDEIPNLLSMNSDMKVEEILTTKLSPWKHESEYRFLKQSNSNKIKIGNITAVGFGNPYGRADNRISIIRNSIPLMDYVKLKNKIKGITKDLELYSVKIENCKVIKDTNT